MSEQIQEFHSCEEVMDYICAQFGDDEDSARCRELQQHLANCPDCSTYCDSIEKMIGLYRATSPCFSEEARRILLESLGISEKE
ncbi:MAG: zf-HC2 domain-containing protein [Bacteroidota bacterium]